MRSWLISALFLFHMNSAFPGILYTPENLFSSSRFKRSAILKSPSPAYNSELSDTYRKYKYSQLLLSPSNAFDNPVHTYKGKNTEMSTDETENNAKFGKTKYWTRDERENLLELRRAGLTWDDISRRVKRTPSACSQKYSTLIKSTRWSELGHKRLLDFTVLYGENWTKISQELNKEVDQYICAGDLSLNFTLLLFTHLFYCTCQFSNTDSCRLHYLQFQREFEVGPWSDIETNMLHRVYEENTVSRRLILDQGFIGVDCEDLLINLDRSQQIFRLSKPANWRNVSHVLHRSSIDCRRQHIKVFMNRDLDRTADIWSDSEMAYLCQLVNVCGQRWVEIGRDLGRSPMQCYNRFHNFYGIVSNHTITRNRSQTGCMDSNDKSIGGKTKLSFFDVKKIECRFRFWDTEEDQVLLDLVNKHGNSWKRIGHEMGRTNRDCFQRYQVDRRYEYLLVIHTPKFDFHTYCNCSCLFQILSVADGPSGWTEEQTKELQILVEELGPKWTEIGKRLRRTAYTCRAAYKRLIDKSNDAVMPRWSDRKKIITEDHYRLRIQRFLFTRVLDNCILL